MVMLYLHFDILKLYVDFWHFCRISLTREYSPHMNILYFDFVILVFPVLVFRTEFGY